VFFLKAGRLFFLRVYKSKYHYQRRFASHG
jgi:hypothetical protein